jgi:hypothetical protein
MLHTNDLICNEYICNIYVAICSGYMPPEYINESLVSKKFDIFSLGAVMIKIIAGPNGRTRYADMQHQEFLDQVRKLSLRLDKRIMFTLNHTTICSTFVCCDSSFTLRLHRYKEIGEKG